MHFQRYPDGGSEWVWFIWGRHPKLSLTWTHSLTLTKDRAAGRWFNIYRLPRFHPQGQSRYGINIGRYSLELMTQDAMVRR